MFDAATAFREAWAGAAGDDFASKLERQGLAAMAARDPALAQIVEELTAPAQRELDLHLEGAAVHGHATSAKQFGVLVSRAADAVREIAKSIGGLRRLGTNLQVLGPAPGSVRVVLKAPAPTRAQDTIPGDADGPSLESIAIERLAAILAQADRPEPDSPLVASVQALSAPARAAVRRVGKAIVDGGWEVSGTTRRGGDTPLSFALTQDGAARIVIASENAERKMVTEVLDGTLDGTRRSIGTVWFEPAGHRAIEAVVSAPRLLDVVSAMIAADPEGPVRARFTVHLSYSATDPDRAQRSYVLEDIRAGVRLPRLDDDEGGVHTVDGPDGDQ